MGLALKFNESAKTRFGDCSTDLQTIVAIHFPVSQIEPNLDLGNPPIKESVYILFSPDILKNEPIKGLPEGESGDAILYTVHSRKLNREETFERLSKGYLGNRTLSELDENQRVEFTTFIDSRVEALHAGSKPNVLESVEVEERGPVVDYNQFVCWVSKNEFAQKAAQATKMLTEGASEDQVWVRDNWYFGKTHEQQKAVCYTCDLNVNPIVNRSAEKLTHELARFSGQELEAVLKDLCVAVLDGTRTDRYLSNLLPNSADSEFAECVFLILRETYQIRGLKNETESLRSFIEDLSLAPDPIPNCHVNSSYSHWNGFSQFLESKSDLPLLQHYISQSEGRIPLKHVDSLSAELIESRKILETTMVPSISAYTAEGIELYSIPFTSDWLAGDKENGYGTGIDIDSGLIAVVHQAPYAFRALLSLEGEEYEDQEHEAPRFLFKEIFREGNTFKGLLEGGKLIELPPEQGQNGILTPFSGLPHSDRITRISASELPALESFGYLQNTLERFVSLSRKFKIPVQLG